MTTEAALFEEILDHFQEVNWWWDGRVTTKAGHNCSRLEVIPNRHKFVSLMVWVDDGVVKVNEIVQEIARFMAVSKVKPRVDVKFDLVEPDSVERLLVYLDEWVGRWS